MRSLENLEISNPSNPVAIILYLHCFMSKQFKYNLQPLKKKKSSDFKSEEWHNYDWHCLSLWWFLLPFIALPDHVHCFFLYACVTGRKYI